MYIHNNVMECNNLKYVLYYFNFLWLQCQINVLRDYLPPSSTTGLHQYLTFLCNKRVAHLHCKSSPVSNSFQKVNIQCYNFSFLNEGIVCRYSVSVSLCVNIFIQVCVKGCQMVR